MREFASRRSCHFFAVWFYFADETMLKSKRSWCRLIWMSLSVEYVWIILSHDVRPRYLQNKPLLLRESMPKLAHYIQVYSLSLRSGTNTTSSVSILAKFPALIATYVTTWFRIRFDFFACKLVPSCSEIKLQVNCLYRKLHFRLVLYISFGTPQKRVENPVGWCLALKLIYGRHDC